MAALFSPQAPLAAERPIGFSQHSLAVRGGKFACSLVRSVDPKDHCVSPTKLEKDDVFVFAFERGSSTIYVFDHPQETLNIRSVVRSRAVNLKSLSKTSRPTYADW